MIDIPCLAAAVCFLIGNAISVAYEGRERNRGHYSYAAFTELQPEFIQKDWAFRRDNQSLELAGGFINAFSWLFLSIPIIQCAIILSFGGTRRLSVHVAMAAFVVAGCVSEFLSGLMYLGASNWGVWLSTGYNLENWVSSSSHDGIGWRVLETSYLITHGTIFWIDSFEYLSLFGALLLFYVSVNSLPIGGPSFSRALAGFGLFIALFSLSDFFSGILRLRDWSTFTLLSILISVVNRLVCLPIFLLILGCQLPRARLEHKQQEVGRRTSVSRSRHWVDSGSSPVQNGLEMVATNGHDEHFD